MLAFKFFMFMTITAYLVKNLKKAKQDGSPRNKLSAAASAVLFVFGVYMLADALLQQGRTEQTGWKGINTYDCRQIKIWRQNMCDRPFPQRAAHGRCSARFIVSAGGI